MKKFDTYRSSLAKALGGLAMAGAFASPALAGSPGVFTVDPSALGYSQSQFEASKMSGNASALLTLDAADQTVQGSGWVDFSAFSLGANQVLPGVSGLGVGYQLWTTFNYTTSYVAGTGAGFGTGGSLYDITSLTFTVYGMNSVNTTFGFAGVDPTAAATVTPGSGMLQIVGTGTLDPSGPNSAAFNAAGGTSFNANSRFTLTAFGETYFTGPHPFYTNAFDSFTNTSTGFSPSIDGQHIALTEADGGVDFVGSVPEPGSLALFGLGLSAIAARVFFMRVRREDSGHSATMFAAA